MTRSVPIGAYLALILALLTVPRPAPAQDATPLALTLEQALDIAHRNNPNLQATRNDETLADWEVRSAYGALLPSATTSAGLSPYVFERLGS